MRKLCIPVGCFATNCENYSESDKLLVNEKDSECQEAVVSDGKVKKDEVSEVVEADQRRRAGWDYANRQADDEE